MTFRRPLEGVDIYFFVNKVHLLTCFLSYNSTKVLHAPGAQESAQVSSLSEFHTSCAMTHYKEILTAYNAGYRNLPYTLLAYTNYRLHTCCRVSLQAWGVTRLSTICGGPARGTIVPRINIIRRVSGIARNAAVCGRGVGLGAARYKDTDA